MADFKSQMKAIQQAVARAAQDGLSKQALSPIAEKCADLIRVRTRRGSGVSTFGGAKTKLAGLADSTKDSRDRKKKQGKLSSLTTPGRSNLTETSQMLESLTGTVPRAGTILIEPKGSRSDGYTNEEIASFAEDGSANRPKRQFLNLTLQETKQIEKLFREDLAKRVAKALK